MIGELLERYEKTRTLCFTGHRPERLPQGDGLARRVAEAIEAATGRGIVNYVSGAMSGFDTLAAEQVIRLKEQYPQIQCILVAPFSVGFFNRKNWTPEWEARLRAVIKKSDYNISLSENAYKGVYYYRDRVMVDMSCEVIAYYDGGPGGTAYTVNRAKEKGLVVYNLCEEVE